MFDLLNFHEPYWVLTIYVKELIFCHFCSFLGTNTESPEQITVLAYLFDLLFTVSFGTII